MGMFPVVQPSDHQSREGVDALAFACSRMRLIWRETPRADVGIDGQIEYVDDTGRATAKLIAAQVKAGPSYFDDNVPEGWRLYPESKHLGYWESFPMPVVVVLYRPSDNRLFWVDARQLLRAGNAGPGVVVPRSNELSLESRGQLFTNVGVSNIPFVPDLELLLKQMAAKRSQNAGFFMSFLELFASGLTNIVRSLYFGMDLAMMIAESYLERVGSEFGIGVGYEEYQFLFEYVQFLSAQHLADVDISDCLIDWVDREMVPHFVAPLTSRGRQLVSLISRLEDEFRNEGHLEFETGLRVAQESIFGVVPMQSLINRFDLISGFRDRITQPAR